MGVLKAGAKLRAHRAFQWTSYRSCHPNGREVTGGDMCVSKGMLLLIGLFVGMAGLSAALTEVTRPTTRDAYRVPSHARQHASHQPGTAPVGLSLAVDGAINPELVPDDRAWAHFLGAMASADPKTRDVALKKVGFDSADRAAFGGALGSLGDELAAATAQRGANKPPEQVLQHEQMAVANARARLQHALSTAGRAQLDTYVHTEVKGRIKIYRGPAQRAGQGGVR